MSSILFRLSLLSLALSVLSWPTAVAQDAKSAKRTGEELMGGEKVLPIREAPLLHPICRFEDHPWFEITALRPGRDLQHALEMNFACSGPLEGQFHVVVTTNGKRHHFPLDGDVLAKRRGVLTCNYSFLDDKSPFGTDVEAYIELTDDEPITETTTIRFGGYGRSGRSGFGRSRFGIPRYSSYTYSRTSAKDPLFFKVSKSATRGNVPVVTFAREIRPEELKLYTQRKKKNGPPPPPPAGSGPVTADLLPVAGTPVLAVFEGDWLPAEVLNVPDLNRFLIHWPQFGHEGNVVMSADTLALKEEMRENLRNDPSQFAPSVVVPVGSLKPIPSGYIIPDNDLKLLPGTPVRVYISNMGHAYSVTEDNGGSVGLVHDNHGTVTHTAKRQSVTISKTTASALAKPETKAIYATRLEKILAAKPAHRSPGVVPMGKPGGYGTATRHYAIAIAIPDGHEAVTRETPLEVGTKVKAYWGRKFTDADVLELHDDGSVVIRWSGWGSVYPVTRETLIISQSRLAELKKKQPEKEMTAKKDSPATEPATESKTTDGLYRLSLQDAGKKKILVIKVIMAITDLDLGTAKDVADNAPIDIKDGLTQNEIDEWRKKFEAAGATIGVRPSKQKAGAKK